jgi:ferredoxin-NADP reductase
MGVVAVTAHAPDSKVFLLRGGLPLFVHKKKSFLPMNLTIESIAVLSPTIRKFTLAGAALPGAGAGAHVIVTIPGPGRSWKNAYSLVSSPEDRNQYEIIVRRVANSRGGSAWLHDHAKLGDMLEVSTPQNLFPIARTAKKHLLLSAGIGLTPFLAYLPVLQAPFELHHLGKQEDAEAFRGLLPDQPNITLHTSRNALDLAALLAAQKLGTHLYICGPAAFMDMALALAEKLGWPAAKIHKESFGGATGGAPFIVHLRRSNLTLQVGPDESLLEVLEAAGLAAPCLCRGGACGECELPVLDGVPEHRDHVLSPARRAANTAILTCVSRAQTPELVLDF